MDAPNHQSDMAHFFDFGEASLPEATQAAESTAVASPRRSYCPAHGTESTDGCLCHGFQDDFAIPEDLEKQSQPAEHGWPDFSNWIPRYHKPAHPCDYCRSRSLECFIFDSGNTTKGCSPCNALFRPCSFSQSSNDKSKSKTALDTLDVVTEDSAHLIGGLTGKKTMRCLGHVGPIETDETDTAPKKGAAAARFPHAAVKILKAWMNAHVDHPYPTEEEKEQLRVETGLTASQVSNWLANTRRRQKSRPKRCSSPSLRPSTEAINIPPGRTWDSLNPFERWKHSPPENEPAPFTAIARAVETFDPPEANSLSSSFNERKNNSNDSTGSFSVLRAPSTTSLETGFTNVSSGSAGSAWSYGSRNSLGSLNIKQDRRRRRRVPTRTARLSLDAGPRMFQCTFCTDKFKTKYDWARHEKSLHLSLEKWICAPIGEVITCSSSGQRKCVFCDAIDPTKEHLATHNRNTCEEKGLEARTFYRKDHLRQHLRLMHGVKMTTSMETWKSEAQYIKSRCGFCGVNFDTWQDRVDHLSKEFRNGATMQNWKGCRGLDAHVAALVTNAMPPYLIANESKSPLPFSATNAASMKQHSLPLEHSDLEFLLPNSDLMKGMSGPNGPYPPFQMGDITVDGQTSPRNPNPASFNSLQKLSTNDSSPHPNPNATCWEILTLRLGRFARLESEKHGIESVTDDMLQVEARNILYGSDDSWNQTAADNPEWLNLFKKAHGLPTTTPHRDVVHQHDYLEDLGLNMNASVDPSFNLENFNIECYLSGSTRVSQAAFSTIPALSSTATTSGTSNMPLPSFSSLSSPDHPDLCLITPELDEFCFKPVNEFTQNNNTNTPFKSSDPFNTGGPIPEIPCTTAGGPLQSNHFEFPSWDQLPEGFEIPGTTADFGSSVSASAALPTSTGPMIGAQGSMWADSELGFGLDMDMDLDMSMDLMMGTAANGLG